jgi:hypothetical protein
MKNTLVAKRVFLQPFYLDVTAQNVRIGIGGFA